MPWVKIDDHFDEHPKMARVGPLGWGVWLAGLAYCNRTLTDGFIPEMVAARFTAGQRGASKIVGELVRAGLWEKCPDGYRVHDFEDYQPRRDDVLREREAARERKEKSRKKSREKSQRESQESHGGVTPPPVPVPVPSGFDLSDYSPPSTETDGRDNGGGDASLSKVQSQVIRALTLRKYTDDEIAPGLEMLEMRVQAGEEITSPVAYVRHFADQARAAVKLREPNRQEIDGVAHEYRDGEGWVEIE